MEGFPDGECESMLCGQYPFSHFWSSLEADMSIAEDWFCPLDGLNPSLHCIFDDSSGSTYLNDIPITESNNEATDIGMASENASLASPFYNLLVEEPYRVNEGNDGQAAATIANFDMPKQKKRPRASRDIQRSPKKGSKKLKSNARGGEESNGGQSSSNCSSEDDIDTALRVKARASRGSATDPQSLYARKRREKINERLRILQKLVPNGTKVDISTMLEEAVQYVKLLQLQIKVLTSDSNSIFAYNGMNIGLYGNMSQ